MTLRTRRPWRQNSRAASALVGHQVEPRALLDVEWLPSVAFHGEADQRGGDRVPRPRVEFRVGHPTGGREIPERTLRQIVVGLQRAGVDPVYLGERKYLDGNEFDHVVHKMITWRAPHPDSDA